MNLLKKIIDLILYGNFWIAAGALFLVWQTQFFLGIETGWNSVAAFAFFATWFLYALHRIVGILRLKDFLDVERYSVIARFRHHIIVYAIIAAAGSIWYFFQLTWEVQIATVLPCFFSLAYVLPIFGKSRRLRDFNQIKIFLVAFVWGWVTLVIPIVASGVNWSLAVFLVFIERMLFVFAITLPFDIRDLKVDGHSAVKTIPASIGVKASVQLGIGLILICVFIVALVFYLGFYNKMNLVALLISYGLIIWLIAKSHAERHDYFYSGLMDGTMVMQGLLVLLSGVFL